MDGGAWWAAVHGVAKSRTRLSNFTFTFHFHALEKAMAAHSSVLAWRIPGRGSLVGAVYGVTQSQTRLKRLSRSRKHHSGAISQSKHQTKFSVNLHFRKKFIKVCTEKKPGNKRVNSQNIS